MREICPGLPWPLSGHFQDDPVRRRFLFPLYTENRGSKCLNFNALGKAQHLDFKVLKQRSPVVSVMACMSLLKAREWTFSSRLLLARQTDWRFMSCTSFSPQNSSEEAKKLSGLFKVYCAGWGGSSVGSTPPLQLVPVWLWQATELP